MKTIIELPIDIDSAINQLRQMAGYEKMFPKQLELHFKGERESLDTLSRLVRNNSDFFLSGGVIRDQYGLPMPAKEVLYIFLTLKDKAVNEQAIRSIKTIYHWSVREKMDSFSIFWNKLKRWSELETPGLVFLNRGNKLDGSMGVIRTVINLDICGCNRDIIEMVENYPNINRISYHLFTLFININSDKGRDEALEFYNTFSNAYCVMQKEREEEVRKYLHKKKREEEEKRLKEEEETLVRKARAIEARRISAKKTRALKLVERRLELEQEKARVERMELELGSVGRHKDEAIDTLFETDHVSEADYGLVEEVLGLDLNIH